jgi:hypothetical protein
MVGTFFGDRLVEKEDGLRTLHGILPRIRGLKAFLYMAAENFELDKKKFDIKILNFKHNMVDDISARSLQWYHSQADLYPGRKVP